MVDAGGRGGLVRPRVVLVVAGALVRVAVGAHDEDGALPFAIGCLLLKVAPWSVALLGVTVVTAGSMWTFICGPWLLSRG